MSRKMDDSNHKNGCRKYENLISRSLFGEIDKSEIPVLHAHLLKCAKCRARFESQKKVLAVTSPKIVGGKDLPGAVWKRLDRTIEKEATTRVYMWVSLGTAAAVILIAIVLAFAFSPGPGKTSPDFAEETESPEADSDLLPDNSAPDKIVPRKRRQAVVKKDEPKQPADSPEKETGPTESFAGHDKTPPDSPEMPETPKPETPKQEPGTGLAENKQPDGEKPDRPDRDAIGKNKSRPPGPGCNRQE